jgi:NTP pyrophosphatase (non-canonical NTP hydrolase)
MEEILEKIFEIASKYEKKNLIEMTLKASEELGELSQAVLSYTNTPSCGYKGKTIEDINEEACDLLIVTMAILSRANISKEDMKKMIHKKLDKWLEKAIQGTEYDK